jgi:hypothetical protein
MIDDRPHSAKRHGERRTLVRGRFRYTNTEKVRAERSAHLVDRTGLKGLQLDTVYAAAQPSDDTDAHDVGPIPHAL